MAAITRLLLLLFCLALSSQAVYARQNSRIRAALQPRDRTLITPPPITRLAELKPRQTVTPVTEISDGQPQAPGPNTDVLTIGKYKITADPNGFVVGSQTILPGGPAVTVASTPVSLGTSGVVVIGTATKTLTNPDVITVGSSTITANPTGFVIGTVTLTPGGPPVVVHSETVSLALSGVVVVGSSSITIPTPFHASSTDTTPGGGTAINTKTTPVVAGSISYYSSDITAFSTNAPSVTAFTISGVTQSYTKLTYTGLESITAVTTVETTFHTTNSNGVTGTRTGPVVVGPSGIHWGCLGLCIGGGGGGRGFCIWPFSCPPGGGNDGEGGGGGGGDPTPTDPTPNPSPTGTATGTPTGTEGPEEPTPWACAIIFPACLDNGVTAAVSCPNNDAASRKFRKRGLGELLGLDSTPTHPFKAKRTLPSPNLPVWQGSITNLVLCGLVFASKVTLAAYHPPLPSPGYGISSAKFYTFGTTAFEMGIQGLYGCTSVIIVSTKGAYVSHFWEVPSFLSPILVNGQWVLGPQAYFTTSVISKMEYGDGTLGQMEGLRGYNQAGQMFGPDALPQILIVAPSSGARNGPLLYPLYNSQITASLQGMFPGAPIRAVTYQKLQDPVLQRTTATGKVLVEYDPVQSRNQVNGCAGQQAAARMWVEDSPTPAMLRGWEALDNQKVAPPGSKNKRQDAAACSNPGTAIGTAKTGTATSPGTGGTVVPALQDCSIVKTIISATADTYCTCSGGIIAGINTVTSAGKVLEECAGTPFPVVSTISATVKPTATENPSVIFVLPTSTAPRETSANQVCAGILGVPSGKTPSDIFTCTGLLDAFNQTQFQLFAPAGTPHSTKPAANKNDESGWATWQGGGCFCINGNFCCAEDATVPAEWVADTNSLLGGTEVLNTVKGSNTIGNYNALFKAGLPCTCDG